jgi:hypothetical protein
VDLAADYFNCLREARTTAKSTHSAAQTTFALPLPLTTSPISHALCFWARMNFKTASALSADT